MQYCAKGKHERFSRIEFEVGCYVTPEFKKAVMEVKDSEWQVIYKEVCPYSPPLIHFIFLIIMKINVIPAEAGIRSHLFLDARSIRNDRNVFTHFRYKQIILNHCGQEERNKP